MSERRKYEQLKKLIENNFEKILIMYETKNLNLEEISNIIDISYTYTDARILESGLRFSDRNTLYQIRKEKLTDILKSIYDKED